MRVSVPPHAVRAAAAAARSLFPGAARSPGRALWAGGGRRAGCSSPGAVPVDGTRGMPSLRALVARGARPGARSQRLRPAVSSPLRGRGRLFLGGGPGSLQCSCLENPRDGGAWWAAVYGVAQSRI